MKAQNIKKIFHFLFFLLMISKLNCKNTTYQKIIHENSNYPKVIRLHDQSVLIFSSIIDENKYRETKLNKNGEKIYSYIYYNLSFSANDMLVASHNDINQESLLIHQDNSSYIIIKKLRQGNIISSLKTNDSKYEPQLSIVSLKCGKIFIAGILKDADTNEQGKIDINIYDPKTDDFGAGLSFGENVKMISCFEHLEYHVYCIYVSVQSISVSKLISQHIEINPISNTISIKDSKIIKSFFIFFNFLKAVPLNETTIFILFRMQKDKYKNTAQKLFYYYIDISSKESFVRLIGGNFIDSDCRYREYEVDKSIDITIPFEKNLYRL